MGGLEAGIPKVGIPKTGIPKVGKRDSEGRDNPALRISPDRDCKARIVRGQTLDRPEVWTPLINSQTIAKN